VLTSKLANNTNAFSEVAAFIIHYIAIIFYSAYLARTAFYPPVSVSFLIPASGVADPDDFCPDLDATFKNV
jgi:hypothetical protein